VLLEATEANRASKDIHPHDRAKSRDCGGANRKKAKKNGGNQSVLMSSRRFSTVFSTGVEILGKKPKRMLSIGHRMRALATLTYQALSSFFDSRKRGRLLLGFRVSSKTAVFSITQDGHERKAHVSTEYQAPEEGAWVQGSNVEQERQNCAEAAAGQG
jgi:hypothetical protein